MTSSSFEDRSELRRTADVARRLRLAADRTAAQLGTLSTLPRTTVRAKEFKRLSRLLDDLDVRATYWEQRLAELS